MRVNDKGGYDVTLRNADGLYLTGEDFENPEWTADPDLARAADDDDGMEETAIGYGLADEDGTLHEGYELVRIPWTNPDDEFDDRFYDDEGERRRYDAIADYVFGRDEAKRLGIGL